MLTLLHLSGPSAARCYLVADPERYLGIIFGVLEDKQLDKVINRKIKEQKADK